jgi:predicted DNA-binding transcriptional regulator AlpA
MGNQANRKLLTDRDCAEMLSCSRATFWRRVKDGTIPKPIKLCGLTRWKKEEIEAAIQNLMEQR